jgi:uncharacterized membrane protein required for colicin V production
MSIVDIVVLVIVGASVIYGLYRGFIQSVLSVVCLLLSIFVAFAYAPTVTAKLSNMPQLQEALVGYTDAVVRVGDSELASQNVQTMDQGLISQVLANVQLHPPLDTLLKDALSSGQQVSVNEAVKGTIVQSALHVISFILVFSLSYLAGLLVLGVLRKIFRFPVLRQLDTLAGGLFGFIRGAAIIYVLSLLMPLIQTVVVDEHFQTLLSQSKFLPIFSDPQFFIRTVGL